MPPTDKGEYVWVGEVGGWGQKSKIEMQTV